MAKIPLFFRSTFPVETYGAMYDPAAMAVAERAKRSSILSQLSNLDELMNAYFTANRLPGIGGSGRGGGVNKRTEMPGILDRANAADIQSTYEARQQEAQDAMNEAKMSAMQAAQDAQDAEMSRNRPQSKAKVYKTSDSTISRLQKIAQLGGAE